MATQAQIDRAKEKQEQRGEELDAAVKNELARRNQWREQDIDSPARKYARATLRKAKARTRRAEIAHGDAKRKVHKLRRKPLRELAYQIAVGEVGVRESGGNNNGTPFTRYTKANGGTYPEPWCGNFMAFCYRGAGSRSVTRAWAAVRLYLPLTGLSRTSSPQRGDIVRFSVVGNSLFHVGMFVSDNGNGTIQTIEGNTGSTVEGSGGGDGVFRRTRPESMVADYIRVSA